MGANENVFAPCVKELAIGLKNQDGGITAIKYKDAIVLCYCDTNRFDEANVFRYLRPVRNRLILPVSLSQYRFGFGMVSHQYANSLNI